MDGMRELRASNTAHEICQDKACAALPNKRGPGAQAAFPQVIAKEYGDAGGLDDLLLVLPELQG